MRSMSSKVVSPAEFKKMCGQLSSDYAGDRQRDAHEFYVFLINQLIDEELLKKSSSYGRDSFQNLFEGILSMSVVCDTCFDTSETLQTFVGLSLPVTFEGKSPIKLAYCLEEYFMPEAMLHRSCLLCTGATAEYRTSIIHPPPILLLHLLRFTNSSKKIDRRVKFPLSLDISSWLSETSESGCFYDLKCVVNHFGNSTDEGHYMSYCKSPLDGSWYCYDDQWVDRMSEESVESKSAYLLFYEQRRDGSEVAEALSAQPFTILAQEKNEAKKTAEKEQPTTQQLNPPSIFNMDDVRKARRDKALLILNKVLPALVVRLRALHRRSKAAADKRGCFSGDELQGPTDGGALFTETEKLSLANQLSRLLESANTLLKEHTDLMKEGNERVLAKKKKANGKVWKKLMDDATKLAGDHAKILHSDEPDEEYGLRKALEDARLILRHPVFALLQPEKEEPMQLQEEDEDGVEEEEEDSADSSEPLFDTGELIGLATGEMRKIVECSLDLKHWITLSAPSLDVITEYECIVRDRVTGLIDDLVFVCEDIVKLPEEFMLKRMEFLKNAIEKPLALDRMRVVDAFDSTKAIEWRRHISRRILHCLEVMDFIVKHKDVLDECKSRLHNNDTAHI